MKKVKFAVVFVFMVLAAGLCAMEAPIGYVPGLSPTVPSGLKACWVYANDAYEIHLSWDENPEANLIGYIVYRALSSNCGYQRLNHQDEIDNDLDGEVDETDNYELVVGTWYEDKFEGLDRGRKYYYRVTAVVNGYFESNWPEPADSGEPTNPSPSSFGCFIATAAYGNAQVQEVQSLQEFRDRFLVNNLPGRLLVRMYYGISPSAARALEHRPILRFIVRKELSIVTFLYRLVL